MKITLMLTVTVLLALSAGAQQSPSPQPATAQTRPCANPSTAPNTPGSNTGYLAKLKKKYDDRVKSLAANGPVPLPSSDDISSALKTSNAPCPPAPHPAAPRPSAPIQTTVPKLPPDVSMSLRCNPTSPSTQGGSRQTTLTLPDPRNFALPKATDFLADGVVPDLAAKTPCYLVKVDPKTGKSFVSQE